MSKEHRDSLRKNGVELVKYLLFEPELMAVLRSNKTLTEDMEEEIEVTIMSVLCLILNDIFFWQMIALNNPILCFDTKWQMNNWKKVVYIVYRLIA